MLSSGSPDGSSVAQQLLAGGLRIKTNQRFLKLLEPCISLKVALDSYTCMYIGNLLKNVYIEALKNLGTVTTFSLSFKNKVGVTGSKSWLSLFSVTSSLSVFALRNYPIEPSIKRVHPRVFSNLCTEVIYVPTIISVILKFVHYLSNPIRQGFIV
jgi:hypothetical protein